MPNCHIIIDPALVGKQGMVEATAGDGRVLAGAPAAMAEWMMLITIPNTRIQVQSRLPVDRAAVHVESDSAKAAQAVAAGKMVITVVGAPDAARHARTAAKSKPAGKPGKKSARKVANKPPAKTRGAKK